MSRRGRRNMLAIEQGGSGYYVQEPSGETIPFRQNRRPNPTMTLPKGITPAGAAFLKDAFAPPDFQHIDVRGVPDEFNGRTLVRQHVLNLPLTDVASGTGHLSGMVFVQLPTPGVACWYGFLNDIAPVWPAAGFRFFPVCYPDTAQLFPGQNPTENFSDFRYLSSAMEIISNDPALTVAGSISVIKMRVSATVDVTGDLILTGDEGFAAVDSRAEYSGKYADGAYAVALNTQPDWEFSPMVRRSVDEGGAGGTFKDTTSTGGYIYGATTTHVGPARFPVLGMGSLEATVFKILVPPVTAGQTIATYTLRCWSTVEYKVNAMSLLYPSTTSSPPYDPYALGMYRAMTGVVPVAVPAHQNANFWTRLLGLMGKGLSAVGLAFPGPWGAAASAAGSLAGWASRRYS